MRVIGSTPPEEKGKIAMDPGNYSPIIDSARTVLFDVRFRLSEVDLVFTTIFD
jgi:hypothetical protein